MTLILVMSVKTTQLRPNKRCTYSGKSQVAIFQPKIKRVLDQTFINTNKYKFSPV